MVTATRDSGSARLRDRPRPSTAQSASGLDSVLAPNAAEKKPARVTPTWTAARKRLGSASSLFSVCPRRPVSASDRTCDSRRETRAISAPENAPPTRTNAMTMMMLSQTSLTSGVLLQRSGLSRDGPGTPHGSGCGSCADLRDNSPRRPECSRATPFDHVAYPATIEPVTNPMSPEDGPVPPRPPSPRLPARRLAAPLLLVVALVVLVVSGTSLMRSEVVPRLAGASVAGALTDLAPSAGPAGT